MDMALSQNSALRSQIEILENRENPSGSPASSGLTENFDLLTPPQLPTGWSQWASSGEQSYLTTRLTSVSGTQSLTSVGTSTLTSRFWSQEVIGADFGAAASIRVDTPTPIEVIARGQNLTGSNSNYLAATVQFGGKVELVEVRNGVRVVLAQVTPKSPIFAGWVRLTLTPVGGSAGITAQRLDTQQYLNSQGDWQSTVTEVTRVTVTPTSQSGLVGVGRVAGRAGNAFVDDFQVISSTTHLQESFNTTPAGQLPTGWKSYVNESRGSVTVAEGRSLGSGRALVSQGSSATTTRAWLDSSTSADAQVKAHVYADSLIPAGVIARGTNLNTTTPTYYSATITRGLHLQLNRVDQGVTTTLRSIKTASYLSQIWVEVGLDVQGSTLKASVFRPDTQMWLGADGRWTAAETAALTVTDTRIRTGDLVGVERVRSHAGAVWIDDFSAKYGAAPLAAPSVNVVSSQSGVVSGVVSFTATAEPATSIAEVQFFLDGDLRARIPGATGVWELNTSSITNGSHVLEVKAVTVAGQIVSTELSFQVFNSSEPDSYFPDPERKYTHIRLAQLAYAGLKITNYEQALALNSLDLIVSNPAFLQTFENVSPTTTKLIYTNLSNLYDGLLTDWLAYADKHGHPRESAFFHVTQATEFTGSSPASRPVTWLWNVSLQNTNGTGARTDLTAQSRGGQATGVKFGAAGQSLTLAYPERFSELNLTIRQAAAAGWQGVLEYVSAVDSQGNPTQWKALPIKSDSTGGFRSDGILRFDPPADWASAKNPAGTDRLFQIRVRTVAGTAAQAPEARSILGRDYVAAGGLDRGIIPAFDAEADRDGDGYLNDQEYADRRGGFHARFEYESRLFYPYYGQMRFVTNPSSPAVQTWAAEYHARLLQSQPLADGLFIDNAHGKVPFPGIAVKESIVQFTRDSAALVHAVKTEVAPNWVVTNTAGSRNEGNLIAGASTGAFEEFLLRPNSATWSTVLDVAELVKGRLNSSDPNPYLILDSHPGSKPTTDPQTQITTLAYYYLLADPEKTYLMFYGGHNPSASWQNVFVPAATYNVGMPEGEMKVVQTGRDPVNNSFEYRVFAREYDNALVLYKPLSYSLGRGTGTSTEASRTEYNLGGKYRVLNPDGSLGPVITKIRLKNAEGAVLIKAT
jgi:hypothetical protein